MDIDALQALECRLKDGRVLLSPCMELAVYMDGPLGPDILDFYDRSRQALGDRLTHYAAETMRGPAAMNVRGESLVKTWCERPRNLHRYDACFLGSRDSDLPSSITLHLHARPGKPTLRGAQLETWKTNIRRMYGEQGATTMPPVTTMHVTLPLDHPLAKPDRFKDWVLGFRILQSRHMVSGHAGLGINLSVMRIFLGEEERIRVGQLASILANHPGLNWENYSSVAHSMSFWDRDLDGFVPRIKRANWITLISERTLAWMGGEERLRKDLGTDLPIEIHPLAHGLAIQAGAEPRAGDITRLDAIPEYRRVARALRHVRIREYPDLGGAFSQDVARRWLEALDTD